MSIGWTTFATPANAGPDYYKIVAGCPASTCPMGTAITLSMLPAAADVLPNPGNGCETGTSLTQGTCRLMSGKFVEFRMKSSFQITADNPILVGQFFASQTATVGTPAAIQGDPSFVLLPPTEQWRGATTLFSATDIADNYLGLVIDDAKVALVQIDGNPVPVGMWFPVMGTTYKFANMPVAGGAHTVGVVPKSGAMGTIGAGVTVYGFDSYVSYGYTGGLDLAVISSIVP